MNCIDSNLAKALLGNWNVNEPFFCGDSTRRKVRGYVGQELASPGTHIKNRV
jgi:hypothetical protein